MAIPAKPAETEIVRRTETGLGHVDWGAIFAGSSVATAISMMFVAFGSGLGLSLSAFSGRSTMPGLGIVMALGLWLLWLQVTASLAGGYVTGRLRRRTGDSPRHEAGMRDGMHGLVVWALGVFVGSLVAAWIATLGTMGAAALGSGAAANPQASAMSDYYVDLLLRPGQGATPAALSPVTAESRAEIGRLLSFNRVTSAQSDNRAYLVRRIAAVTGLSEQDAAQRLDTTLAAMKAQADQARRLGIILGFITTASLLVSAVAAWWAAMRGGSHREENIDHSRYAVWR